MYGYRADPAERVAWIVTRDAGRMGGGDFAWTFDESDDPLTEVDAELNARLAAYESRLISVEP